jgi:ribonuclease VapC
MIIDTSALMAIVRQEPDAERYARAIESAGVRRMSASTLVELCMVVEGQLGPDAMRQTHSLLRSIDVLIEPFTEEQARIAHQAFCDFGKGNHPAGLNFGDCFAYALAKDLREPLLYKGGDFAQTDVESAL